MDSTGFDDQGNEYDSPAQFWAAVAARRAADAAAAAEGADCAPGGDAAAPAWYSGAVSHWDAQTPDDSGVLGGHTAVAPQDVRDSAAFLRRALGAEALAEAAAGRRRLAALDAGAGVGRVAEALLLQHCAVVDLVEPSAHLLAAAERRLAAPPAGRWPEGHAAERFTCVGLEGCAPEAGRYDIVWVQWALMYLTDDDAVAFLKRCAAALRPGGVIILKENVAEHGSFVVDTADASVTRCHAYYMELFQRVAGLTVLKTALQRDWPKALFRLRMYALQRPADEAAAGGE